MMSLSSWIYVQNTWIERLLPLHRVPEFPGYDEFPQSLPAITEIVRVIRLQALPSTFTRIIH
jgi:hypothetical protein